MTERRIHQTLVSDRAIEQARRRIAAREQARRAEPESEVPYDPRIPVFRLAAMVIFVIVFFWLPFALALPAAFAGV